MKMSLSVRTLCLVLLCCGANSVQLKNRIVGGLSSSNRAQFPYQVLLKHVANKVALCGGAILNDRYVVTAAHCVRNIKHPAWIYGVVNIMHDQDAGTMLDFSHIISHPRFNPYAPFNDIALLRTNKTIIFDDFVQAVKLPSHNVMSGVAAVISGWGITNMLASKKNLRAEDVTHPTTLQYKEVSTLSLGECIEEFRALETTNIDKWDQVNTYMNHLTLCTRNVIGSGSCKGDSGGPLVDVANGTLIGIISWSVGCADGFPDVHTRVYPQVEWINQQIDKLS